jgi:hypothetical protein
MIYIWNHDIARQRQQERLAAAEGYRLARIARDQNVQRHTGSYKKTYAAVLVRARGLLAEARPKPIGVRRTEPANRNRDSYA